jgi:simple sugar transport system ATP-binding protein
VEIIKVLIRGAKVLILDEPTSILTPQETKTLFQALQNLVDEGKTIVFITHKLEEVMALSDRVSVLRRGRLVKTLETKSTEKRALARMMVGRDVLFHVDKQPSHLGSIVLEVNGVSSFDDRGLHALREASFKVRAGEVLGVAGIAGNGQEELIEVITGLRKASAGSIYLMGEDITNHSSKMIAEKGVAHIPEKRIRWGVVPDMSVAENLVLRDYGEHPFSKGLFLDKGEIKERANKLIAEYGIATSGAEASAKLLSGGNIQRLILARELSRDPLLIVAAHPTYGLDVGATEQIRRLILDQGQKGSAILLVSEDLDEIFALSDRIAVMFEGRILKIAAEGEIDFEEVGLLISGGSMEEK